ncbi:MAG: hypothetical protein OEV93_04070 [Candidatus Moranbacteria bacterium]|nr:hypothetical protein [Candidatus Moranbacteria bacterium]
MLDTLLFIIAYVYMIIAIVIIIVGIRTILGVMQNKYDVHDLLDAMSRTKIKKFKKSLKKDMEE